METTIQGFHDIKQTMNVGMDSQIDELQTKKDMLSLELNDFIMDNLESIRKTIKDPEWCDHFVPLKGETTFHD